MTKDEIRAILGDAVREDGGLYRLTDYIHWSPEWAGTTYNEVTLDGSFTADELEAIAAHMRAQGGK